MHSAMGLADQHCAVCWFRAAQWTRGVVLYCVKDDIENTDANGLKRFPEISSSHSIPPKRIRDVLASSTDTVRTIAHFTTIPQQHLQINLW